MLCFSFSYAQKNDSTQKGIFAAYPLVFYSPETELGFGGYGFYAFRFKNQNSSTPPSQVSLTATYTTLKQISLYAPYQLFIGDRDYIIKGELGYYEYIYRFFGTGNILPKTVDEFYKVNFPRLRVNVLKSISPNLYIGGNYAYDNFVIKERDPEGILIKDSLTGSNSSVVSGIGPSLTFDSRDNIFNPSKGYYLDIKTTFTDKTIGATHTYGKIELDASTYYLDKWENVWAFNYYGGFNTGDPIINDMLQLGGQNKNRGLFKGKYRDRILNAFQTEYRFKVYKRFSATTFISVGEVNSKLSDVSLNYLRVNYGAGIRYMFNKSERINIRLDYGLGKNTSGFYITVGEAF